MSDGGLEEGDGALLALAGHDLNESDARGIFDADMNELPADAVVAVTAPGCCPVMRCSTEPIRPSFLISR
ncbi:hypothetical protein [Mesorhizobium sp. M0676]|uniref:hypothetical protein n=1 Tax=Mesorhizobium sp. M0676 TaxID=2956984 RepID=UPI00333AAA7C